MLVVGAGLIGRAAAYYLALSGARVRLVDGDPDPSATSRASLGVLTHVNGRDDPLGNFYSDAHALHAKLALQLRDETGLDVGWRDLGGLDLVSTEEEEAEARQALAFNLERGCPAQWLDAAQVRELEPHIGERIHGALHFPGDHCVDPEALSAALLAAAAGRRAEVELGAEVTSLEPAAEGGITARIRDGGGAERRVGADAAVLAAGAWSRELSAAGGMEVAVRPIRGQQARFRHPNSPRHILRHGGYHALPWGDGIIVGATVEEVGFDTGVTTEAATAFSGALEVMLGSGGDLVEQRAGLRPKPRKGRPVVGPLPGCEEIMVATGHYKSGVLMGPLTGQVVAQWLLTGSPGRDMAYFAVKR